MNEPAEDKPSRGGIIVGIVVTVLMLYVLGIGPAARKVQTDPTYYFKFCRVYAPVLWLYRHAPPLRMPILRYVDLWNSGLPLPP